LTNLLATAVPSVDGARTKFRWPNMVVLWDTQSDAEPPVLRKMDARCETAWLGRWEFSNANFCIDRKVELQDS
jgi:hypothetical protein